MRALRHKYTQKPIGGESEDIFRDTSIRPHDGHDVPVENFLNAQCENHGSIGRVLQLIQRRLQHHRHWYSCSGIQSCPRHWQLQPLGPQFLLRLYRLLSPPEVRFIGLVHLQEERF